MGLARRVTGFIALGIALLPQVVQGQQVAPYRWIAEIEKGGASLVAESPSSRFLLLDSEGLAVRDRQTGEQWTLGVEGARGGVWSPQGNRIAFTMIDQGATHIWTMPMDAAMGRPTGPAQRITLEPGVQNPAFSSDGRSVAFQRAGKIYSVPSTGGEERLLVDEPYPTVRPHFSPDGEWLYYRAVEEGAQDWIRRAPTRGGSSERVVRGALLLGVSPSGKYLAYYPTAIPYQSDDATVAFATVEGKEFARLRLPKVSYWGRWGGTGERFLFDNIDVPAGLNRVRFSDGALEEVSPKSSYDRLAAYSPDGRFLATQRMTGSDYRIVLLEPSGRVIRSFATAEPILGVRHVWSPDGRHIAAVDLRRRLVLIEVSSGRERVLYEGSVDRGMIGTEILAGQPVWSADGQRISFLHFVNAGSWEVHEVDLEGRDRVVRQFTNPDQRGALTFSILDRDRVAVTRPGRISILPIPGGAERVVFEGEHAGQRARLSLSPDKRWVSIPVPHASGGETLAITPVDGGAPRVLSFVQPCGMDPGTWHPDGRHLVVASPTNCGNRFDFYLVPLDGGAARNLTAADKVAVDTNSATIAPDGSAMVYDSEEGWYGRIGEIDVARLAASAGLPR